MRYSTPSYHVPFEELRSVLRYEVHHTPSATPGIAAARTMYCLAHRVATHPCSLLEADRITLLAARIMQYYQLIVRSKHVEDEAELQIYAAVLEQLIFPFPPLHTLEEVSLALPGLPLTPQQEPCRSLVLRYLSTPHTSHTLDDLRDLLLLRLDTLKDAIYVPPLERQLHTEAYIGILRTFH